MPAKPIPEFVTYCVELLSAVGTVRMRRMFGGYGLYVDDLFCALIIEERLYLKTDDETRAKFEAAGCEPFRYQGAGDELVTVSYWTPPEEALESPASMQPWARLALGAAVRANGRKAPKRR